MTRVNPEPSKVACIGMLGGMLLLAFAGTVVVMTPPPLAAEVQKEGAAFLQKETRRLLATNVTTAVSDAQAQLWRTMGISAGVGWGSIGVQVFIALCFALLYDKEAVQPIIEKRDTLNKWDIPDSGSDDFENGICECFSDMWVCIHGLCCPLVRIAHTNAVAGIMGFWETALVYFCCALLTGGIGPCCLMVYWRKQLKEIMRIEDHLINDLCVTCFCPQLSLCQQGTAVDRFMGYEVTGCCNVEFAEEE